MDYELELLNKMHGLRQGKLVKEYTKDFLTLLIRMGHSKSNKEKVARYINELKPIIEEELSFIIIF